VAGQGLLFLALTDMESKGLIEEVWAAVDEADTDLDHFHVASSLLGVHHCWDSMQLSWYAFLSILRRELKK